MKGIILEARNVSFRYPRGMEAIRDISFHIRKQEKIALVGANGAGKSTLLSMFNGMIRPDSGTLLVDNEPVRYDAASLRKIRKNVGFVLQNPDRQLIAPTVYQDVAFGPVNLGYSEEQVKESVALALHRVGLEGFGRRPIHHLSGGEKKRAAIAGVLAMDPDVLVLDEPTTGLDPAGSEDLMELLDELNHDGKTIVISTHDVELAYPWAHRAILLHKGKILAEDVPEVAFGNPDNIRTARLSVPILLDLHEELRKRGLKVPEGKPRTVLDMMGCIDSLLDKPCCHPSPGKIFVCNVDSDASSSLAGWVAGHPAIAIGAMGTRAKQRAEQEKYTLAFTYGVIDKCILRALLGHDTLILTTGTMVDHIFRRIGAYRDESGIPVDPVPVPEPAAQTGTQAGVHP